MYLIMFNFVLGDITQKGYEKKRTRLLTPYIPQQQPQGKFNFLVLTIKRNIAANTDAWTNKVPYQTHQYWHVFRQWRHVFHNYSTLASKVATEASPGSSVNWSPSMDVGQSRNYRDGPIPQQGSNGEVILNLDPRLLVFRTRVRWTALAGFKILLTLERLSRYW